MRVHTRVKEDTLMDLETNKKFNYNEEHHDLLYTHNHAPYHTTTHTQLRSNDPVNSKYWEQVCKSKWSTFKLKGN